ncbi:MAG TPA: RsmB/NOP family class I SAM-dependent RNA methyltransferase [archaeon]|nr:RsmB/NOP family class I SAM-dependent RNA methyltransferase [archaeon]
MPGSIYSMNSEGYARLQKSRTVIPDKFRERYAGLVEDKKEFFDCLVSPLPRAFRINTIKADKKQVLEKFGVYGIELKPVVWYPDAFVTNDLRLGNTIEHFMGYIYIQELTSMLPAVVASKELSEKSFVVDCCAAPGSKTTQAAGFMGNKGCIIANDINYMRIKALKFNLEKLGVLNTIVTNQDFRFFTSKEKADTVLLDAPCTSEGTVRKDWNVLSHWSEAKIFGMSKLQKQLILRAFDLVKTGGQLIYSTCTFSPEENEEVVQYLLQNRQGVEIEKITLNGFKLSSGIQEWGKQKFDPEIRKTCRIWPHHNDTDGFFIAKIRK